MIVLIVAISFSPFNSKVEQGHSSIEQDTFSNTDDRPIKSHVSGCFHPYDTNVG